MILLKVFFLFCYLAYGTSLNERLDVDAKSPHEIQVMARDSGMLSSGGSAYLDLYIYYGKQLKKHIYHRYRILKYLREFLKKVNEILATAKPTLTVQFRLVGASQWNEDFRALTKDKQALDSELLKAVLKVFGNRLEVRWHKERGIRIDAVLLVTMRHIRNVSMSELENITANSDMTRNQNYNLAGIAGRIGGICLKEHFVAAATDDGHFGGVTSAARQLSFPMGAVEDGQGPPGREYVQGSDGASWCPYSDGYLMGKPNGQNSERLSTCSGSSFIMGIRQRGSGCYNSIQPKELSDREILE
ncbi:venom metalloproteinase antarease-like TfasMP_A [Ixodes scapularis]|uniref:venom metalloproteinase antarease-like TfasMP_A n=1 Tax=Ixodes scapularis TaxID=6945 RepID=UPI001C390799|nr:venom metalloproteinase antarease-like TfasMP_A [Ixodes scapularis]